MTKVLFLLLALGAATACKPQPGNSLDESPSTAVPAGRLVDGAAAGNGASADPQSGVTSVDPQPAGSTASAPGAGTSGPAGAGQGTGGADGGRTLGQR